MKLRKQLLPALLTLCMIVSIFSGLSINAYALNGNGTQASPYMIYNQSDLEAITSLSAYYQLGASFTVSNYAGLGSAAINSSSSTSSPYAVGSNGFSGTLDGNGYTITVTNRNITASGKGGVVNYLAPGGVVKNLNVAGSVSATGSYDAIGGVVGYNSGIIENVTSAVTVSASGSYNVGGITGFNNAYYSTTGGPASSTTNMGIILNCVNNGAVTGYSKVGGICGENAGLINSCSNTAAIVGTNDGKSGIGGIAGRNGNNNTAVEAGRIWNCMNSGDITIADGKWAGGICGFNNSLSPCVNCYDRGDIDAVSYTDPISGKPEGFIGNCYYLLGVDGVQGYDGSTSMPANLTPSVVESLNVGTPGRWTAAGGYPVPNYTAAQNDADPSGATVSFAVMHNPQLVYTYGETFTLGALVIDAVDSLNNHHAVDSISCTLANGTVMTEDTPFTVTAVYGSYSHDFAFTATVTPDPEVGIFLAGPDASDDNTGTDRLHPVKTLARAIAAAPTNGTIYVQGQVTLNGFSDAAASGKNLTVTRSTVYDATLLHFTGGNSTLQYLTIDGGGRTREDTTGNLIRVTGGSLTLNGAVLQNNAESAVYNNGGTVNMNGGTITNCSAANGGAIKQESGHFNFNTGASITNCSATNGGAAALLGTNGVSDFALKGGTISGCSATNGGALYIDDWACGYINGGSITGCSATNGGAAYILDTEFTVAGGTIGGTTSGSGNTATRGGAIYVGEVDQYAMTDGQMFFNGGNIKGNSASYGGAVYLADGSYTSDWINAKTTISGNSASSNGGGIYMETGADLFLFSKGLTISSNSAVNGGGVYMAGGDFTMRAGATITNNSASSNGGGIYLGGGSVKMEAGSISGNTASSNGAGLFKALNTTFNYCGSGISNNNVVYLANTNTTNCYITVSGTVSGNIKIKCKNANSNTVVARKSSGTFSTTELGKFSYINTTKSFKRANSNKDIAIE